LLENSSGFHFAIHNIDHATCFAELNYCVIIDMTYGLIQMFLCNVDLKSVLRKKRRDGKSAPLQPLTKIQHIYIGRLIEKYGEDYKV
jgi:hypothetical protein